MQDFRKLTVWYKSHLLALAVYDATKLFPREELYGLTSQTRRSAASIPTNIAEGCGRGGRAEFRQFLKQSAGSASELEYLLLLGKDLGYMPEQTWQKLTADVLEVKRMLSSLIRKLAPS